jgi:hypothetical protein
MDDSTDRHPLQIVVDLVEKSRSLALQLFEKAACTEFELTLNWLTHLLLSMKNLIMLFAILFSSFMATAQGKIPKDHQCSPDPLCASGPPKACKFIHVGNMVCDASFTAGTLSCNKLISCEVRASKCEINKKPKADACVKCHDECKVKSSELSDYGYCFAECAKKAGFDP